MEAANSRIFARYANVPRFWSLEKTQEPSFGLQSIYTFASTSFRFLCKQFTRYGWLSIHKRRKALQTLV